jgi:hypothetical protein
MPKRDNDSVEDEHLDTPKDRRGKMQDDILAGGPNPGYLEKPRNPERLRQGDTNDPKP